MTETLKEFESQTFGGFDVKPEDECLVAVACFSKYVGHARKMLHDMGYEEVHIASELFDELIVDEESESHQHINVTALHRVRLMGDYLKENVSNKVAVIFHGEKSGDTYYGKVPNFQSLDGWCEYVAFLPRRVFLQVVKKDQPFWEGSFINMRATSGNAWDNPVVVNNRPLIEKSVVRDGNGWVFTMGINPFHRLYTDHGYNFLTDVSKEVTYLGEAHHLVTARLREAASLPGRELFVKAMSTIDVNNAVISTTVESITDNTIVMRVKPLRDCFKSTDRAFTISPRIMTRSGPGVNGTQHNVITFDAFARTAG